MVLVYSKISHLNKFGAIGILQIFYTVDGKRENNLMCLMEVGPFEIGLKHPLGFRCLYCVFYILRRYSRLYPYLYTLPTHQSLSY